MKRKLIALAAMVCVAAFALAACGGGNSGGGNAGGGTSGGGSTGGSGSTFDVGEFTVDVPAGWTAFEQSDRFGEKDADGNYPVDPEHILIAKAANELEALSNPSVRIYYNSPNTTVMDGRSFYDNVTELEGVKINGVDCDAFQAADSIGDEYQFIIYDAGDAVYEINILVSVDGKETGITWESPEVQTILNSLKAKQS